MEEAATVCNKDTGEQKKKAKVNARDLVLCEWERAYTHVAATLQVSDFIHS